MTPRCMPATAGSFKNGVRGTGVRAFRMKKRPEAEASGRFKLRIKVMLCKHARGGSSTAAPTVLGVSERLHSTFDDQDFSLVELDFQPFLELSQERSGFFRRGPEHAVNHDFIPVGHVPHPPKAFVRLRKKGQSSKAPSRRSCNCWNFSASTGRPSLK